MDDGASRDLCRDRGRPYPGERTEARWARVAPLLPAYDSLTADRREKVNACLYLEKTGCP